MTDAIKCVEILTVSLFALIDTTTLYLLMFIRNIRLNARADIYVWYVCNANGEQPLEIWEHENQERHFIIW